MSSNPVPILIIVSIYVAAYMVIEPNFTDAPASNTYGLDQAPTTSEPSSSFFDVLASLVHSVWGFVTLLLGALVFNVPGTPPWIQFPIAAAIIGSLGWSIASLIRGKGD